MPRIGPFAGRTLGSVTMMAGVVGVSFLLNFEPGEEMGNNFYLFAKDAVLILPPACRPL